MFCQNSAGEGDFLIAGLKDGSVYNYRIFVEKTSGSMPLKEKNVIYNTFNLKEMINSNIDESKIVSKNFKLVLPTKEYKVHKSKLRSMVLDASKAVLYSTGDSKLLYGLNLTAMTCQKRIKTSNS